VTTRAAQPNKRLQLPPAGLPLRDRPCSKHVVVGSRAAAAAIPFVGGERVLDMDRRKVERWLAVFSIASAAIHFFGETWVHLKFGQFLPMLIVDYIAISLLLFGGVRSLQTGAGAGLLCGAWGFTFCLNYRALFWRVEVILEGRGTPVLETMTQVLAVLLVVSMVVFLITLALCNPRKEGAA